MNTIQENSVSYTFNNGKVECINNADCLKIYNTFIVTAPLICRNELMVQLTALQDFYEICKNELEREYVRSKVIIDIVRIIEDTTNNKIL